MKRPLAAIALLGLCYCGSNNPTPAPVAPPRPPETQVQLPPQTKTAKPPGSSETKEKTVVVYYRHPYLEGVIPLKRLIYDLPDPTDEVKQVIEQLTMPPKPEEGMAIWPDNIYIREIFFMAEGTVVIDFNGQFVASLSAGTDTETFLVYSLVNTVLENFPKYKKVHILIDGMVQETFKGHIDIESPLSRTDKLYTIIPEKHIEDEIIIENLAARDGDGSVP